MKFRSLVAWPTAVLVIAAGAHALAQQPITLRYKWTPGDVLTYRMVVRTESNMSGGPQGTANVEQTMTQTLKVAVSTISPDGMPILHDTIQAVTVDVNGPMGKLSYDSSKPPGADADLRVQTMARTFGSMVGAALSVTMAPNGAIRRIDGSQRIVDKLMKDLPRDPMAGGMAQNIKQMLSEDALRASLEQSFCRLPDGPVKVGDTWTAEQSVGADTAGKITGTSTFTLKSIEGTGDAAIAHIAVTLALKQQDVPSSGTSMAMKLGNARGEGELVFNIAQGRIERNAMRTDMPTSLSMRGPDGGPVTMQNNTKTTMTMELVK